MPSYIITSPEGQKFRISAPEGVSQDQVLSYAQSNFPAPKTGAAKPEQGIGRTIFDQAQQGVPLIGTFSDEISDALGSLGAGAYMKAFRPDLLGENKLEDVYSEARRMSKERLDAQMEQEPVLSIASQIVGGLGTSAPLAATKAGTAITNSLRSGNALVRSGKAAAIGVPSAALYGAGSADDGKGLEGAVDAASYGLIPAAFPIAGAAGRAVAKAITPTIEEGMRPVVSLAQKYKIPVSISQVTKSNAIKNFQKVSKELPFSGEPQFREKQMEAFNRALIKTVGGNSNRFSPELMDNLFTKVGKEFDNFGRGKKFNLNDEFITGTSRILDDADIISHEGAENLKKAISKIYSNADESGVISGEVLGKARAEVNRLARKAGKLGNGEMQELLHDLENVIIDTMKAGDDVAGQAFAKTKQKYKNLLVIEPLTAKAKGGNISPSLLQNRVSKIYGREFVRGNAGEIGDLARIGNELLPDLGGSDTVQKAIYAVGGGAGALALTNPALAAVGATKAAVTLGANRAIQGINRNQTVVNAALKKSRLQDSSPKKIKITPRDRLK